MPGIFGAAGSLVSSFDAMERHFRSLWDGVETSEPAANLRIGGHAFTEQALLVGESGEVVGRDGEWSFYRLPAGGGENGAGNVVRMRAAGVVELVVGEAGVFPLYYTASREGLAFSSLLRPLGRALGASPDFTAVSQFLRTAYTCAGRSLFSGISRLLPGQVLHWELGEGPRLQESSRSWTEVIEEMSRPEEAADEAIALLRQILAEGLASRSPNVLMMSAGWDSRTLLAMAKKTSAPLSAHSHGDPESRELRIARHVCETAGVDWTGRCINGDVWEPEHLYETFARTETLIFPHWAWAGHKNMDAATLLSGVLGEVLGGHYGMTQFGGSLQKAIALVRGMASVEDEPITGEDLRKMRTHLSPWDSGTLWYLRAGAEEPSVLGSIEQDIGEDLQRLVDRGVPSPRHLLEAFVTEHRGVQYIAGQALSSRGHLDVALPFADPRFLRFASRVAPHLKIHNRVSQVLTRRAAPDLLMFPMAATLVPASAPLLMQEGSRFLRKVYEEARMVAFAKTGGRMRRPRLGWVDFEFLRDGKLLNAVSESLTLDIWDRSALERRGRQVLSVRDAPSLHPMFDQMGKIMTVDRMLG